MQDEHLKAARRASQFLEDDVAETLARDLTLPNVEDAYKAYGRASPKAIYTLHCVLAKGRVRSFEYVHLDSDGEFDRNSEGHVITMRFCGSKTMELRIYGRNLWQLFDYIHQHRMPWLRIAERDFAADKEPIITRLDIKSLEASDAG